MRLLALVGLLLVACEDGTTIEVRVPAELGVTEVELFLGVTPCMTDRDGDGMPEACTGVAPMGAGFIDGTVYDRDDNETLVAKVTDGVAVFQLAGRRVETILALGSTNNEGSPTAAAVLGAVDPASGPQRVIATLAPVGPDLLAVRWRKARRMDETIGVGCAGVKPAGSAQATFVVAQGDPDCDDFGGELECDTLVWHATMPLEGECLTPVDDNGEHWCAAGARACVDGEGDKGCLPTELCIPDKLCSCADAPDVNACVGDVLANPTTTSFIACTIPMSREGADRPWIPCNQAITADLRDLFGDHPCTAVSIGLPGQSAFGSTVDILPGPNGELLTVGVSRPSAPCFVSFTANGTNRVPDTQQEDPLALALLGLSVRPAVKHDLLLPIYLTFTRELGCQGNPVECLVKVAPDETIDACQR